MGERNPKNEAQLFQWNSFEKAITNYSIVVKMFQHMEDDRDLFTHMPKVFVEETIFDACQLIMRGKRETSFFCKDAGLRSIECRQIENQGGVIYSPVLLGRAFGYGTLYIYPLKRGIHVFAYLILGKRKSTALDQESLRGLDFLGEILNRFILLNMRVNASRAEEGEGLGWLDSRLATTKTLLESTVDQLPHALFIIDRNGTICFANGAARDGFLGGNQLLAGENIATVVPGLEEGFLEMDEVFRGEIHHRRGQGYRLYALESYPIKDSGGEIVLKSIILKNVADERMGEEETIHKGRMESMGRLAGGIAHDFNNLLTGILGYASLLKRMTEQEEQLSRYAEVIENTAKRAAVLTSHLLSFSRRQRADTVDQVDLNALLGDVLFLMRESFRDITIESVVDGSLPSVRGDAGELQHAILDLCINAKDAMPEGGTLRVRTEKKSSMGGREFAVITIEDTGRGIDEHLQAQVFQPAFGTKSESKRLGMGLYLVQKVVRGFGGLLELESGKDRGTSFNLYFPLETGRQGQSSPTGRRAAEPKKGTILVVDDEEIVRDLLKGILTAQGFTVLLASDGAEGIAVFGAREESIDLVILDMIMPGMKGEVVLDRLRRASKEVKVIISSGFMSEEQREKLEEYGTDGFLDKPYSEKDVINIVKSVLSLRQPADPT